MFRRAIAFRHYSSALYITGERAVDTYPTVNPHVDLERCLDDFAALEKNIVKRKSNLNIERLKKTLGFFLKVDGVRSALEERKKCLGDTMTELYGSGDTEQLEKLKIHHKIVKEDLKNLKAALWPVEERIVSQVLKLPNALHERTPIDDDVIITHHRPHEESATSPESHVDIGHKNDLLAFSSPYNYYLKNEAAEFELEAKYFFGGRLRECGYLQFSNADFVKSAIVEGCGFDHTASSDSFILHHDEDTPVNENGRLHLVGGGSTCSFAAYFTRNFLAASTLPLRLYAIGRQYRPAAEADSSNRSGLFDTSQASVVEVFSMAKGDRADEEVERTISEVTSVYKAIDYPFRVCLKSAEKLAPWESMRIGFEMYSPFYRRHVEVGFLSVSGDYISKRLQIMYGDRNESDFPHIISGTVLNVPRLLGCVLELDSSAPFKRPGAFESVSLFK